METTKSLREMVQELAQKIKGIPKEIIQMSNVPKAISRPGFRRKGNHILVGSGNKRPPKVIPSHLSALAVKEK